MLKSQKAFSEDDDALPFGQDPDLEDTLGEGYYNGHSYRQGRTFDAIEPPQEKCGRFLVNLLTLIYAGSMLSTLTIGLIVFIQYHEPPPPNEAHQNAKINLRRGFVAMSVLSFVQTINIMWWKPTRDIFCGENLTWFIEGVHLGCIQVPMLKNIVILLLGTLAAVAIAFTLVP
jgi:hypothetical protein